MFNRKLVGFKSKLFLFIVRIQCISMYSMSQRFLQYSRVNGSDIPILLGFAPPSMLVNYINNLSIKTSIYKYPDSF